MTIKFDSSALKRTRRLAYALRFFFGGAVTVVTGTITQHYGPVFVGLFLSCPAIFPASATLMENMKKEM